MTRIEQSVIAYLPTRNVIAEETTRRSVGSASRLDFPIVLWHAGDAPTPGPSCLELHPTITPTDFRGEILDYENGNLAENWLFAFDDMFGRGAEWALWSSNDVIWHSEAGRRILEVVNRANPLTIYIVYPFAVGLFSKTLWDTVRPFYDCNWPPSMHEDSNFLSTVLWRGGEVDSTALEPLMEHLGEFGIRTFGDDSWQLGQHWINAKRNLAKYQARWGHSPLEWPLPRVEPSDCPGPPPPPRAHRRS